MISYSNLVVLMLLFFKATREKRNPYLIFLLSEKVKIKILGRGLDFFTQITNWQKKNFPICIYLKTFSKQSTWECLILVLVQVMSEST